MNRRPLAGVRVVVTRPAHQSEGLCAAFQAAGATVERLPLLEVVPPADRGPLERAAAAVSAYRWLAFTSANAVRALVDAAGGRLPAGLRVAAVGEATSRALRRRGLEPALVTTGGGAALAAELAAVDPGGGRVLLPAAADARPETADLLRESGYRVEVVVAYEKRLPPGTVGRAGELFPAGGALGWVTFTSPRIATAFAGLFTDWGVRCAGLRAASIGATTSAALRRLGVAPAAEATRPADAALVAAVATAARS